MAPCWPGTTKAPRKLVFLFTLSLSVTYLFYSLLSCYSSLQFPLQEAGLYLQPESQISPVDAIRIASLKPDTGARDFAAIRASSLPELSSSVQSAPSFRSIQRSSDQAASSLSASLGRIREHQPPTVRTRDSQPRVPQRLLVAEGAPQDLRIPGRVGGSPTTHTHTGSTTESASSWDNKPFIATGQGFSTLDSAGVGDTERSLGRIRENQPTVRTRDFLPRLPQRLLIAEGAPQDLRIPGRVGASPATHTHTGSTTESVSSSDNEPFIATGQGFSTLDSPGVGDTERSLGRVDSTPVIAPKRAIGASIISADLGLNTLDSADQRFNSLDSTSSKDTDQRFIFVDSAAIKDIGNRFNSFDSVAVKDSERTFYSLHSTADGQFNSVDSADQQFNSLDSPPIKDIDQQFIFLDNTAIKDTDFRFNSLDSSLVLDTDHQINSLDIADQQFNSLDSTAIKDTGLRFNSLGSTLVLDTDHQFNSLDIAIKDSDLRVNLLHSADQQFNSLDSTVIKETNLRFNSLDSTPILETDHQFNSLDIVIKDIDHRFKSLHSADQQFNSLDSTVIKETNLRFNSLDSTPILETDHQFYPLDIAIKDSDHRFKSLHSADQQFNSLDSTVIKDTDLRFNSLDSTPLKDNIRQINSFDIAPNKDIDLEFNSQASAPFKDTDQRFISLDRSPVEDTEQRFNSLDSSPVKDIYQHLNSLESVPDKDTDRRFNSLDSASIRDPERRFSSSESDASLSTRRIIGAPNIANNQGFSTLIRDTERRFISLDLTTSQEISTLDSAPIEHTDRRFRTADSDTSRVISTLDSAPVISLNQATGASIISTNQRSRTSDNAPLVYTEQRSSTLNRSLIQTAYKGATSSDTVSNKPSIPSTDQGSSTPDKVPIQPTDLRLRTLDHSPKTHPFLWGLSRNQDGGQTTPSSILATPLSDLSTAGSVPFSGPGDNYQQVTDTSSGEVRRVLDFTGDEMRPPLHRTLDWEKTPLAATEMIPPSHTGYVEREAQESSTTDEELSRRISINSTVEYGDKRLPQAIIIGVKKGGTRALLEALRAHPDVRAVGVEPHFFDRNYEKGLEWYRDLMPRTIEGQITMEKTPSYFVTNDAPQRIHSMAKDTKLIVVVRNPVTRAISDYTQTLSKKPEIPSFEVLAFKNRTLGLIDASWSALRIGIYALHLESWMQYFPLSQILFVSGERLITNPAEELAKVQEFLGLQRIITEKYFHFNKTKGFPCLKKPEDTGAPRCLGKSKGRTHPKIDPDVIQRLRKFYKPFNAMFYQMTGQDFQWEKEELEG